MQTTKVLTTLAALVALSGFAELGYAQPVPTTIAFPMIGVGFNQFLQLNVISFPPNPCVITVGVLGPKGEVIVAFEEGSPDRPLIVGNQVSFVPQRKEIRPVVILMPPPGSAAACQGQATAEVFDGLTGADWVVTPGLVPPAPQQIPPGPATMPIFLGPVGLSFQQTARLSVVAYPPNPCSGTMGFVDTTGKAIVPLTTVNLAPNQAISGDVTGFQAGTTLGSQRPEVIGVFTPGVSTAAPPGICIPSVEVFDRITGYTRVLIPPGPTTIPPGPTTMPNGPPS